MSSTSKNIRGCHRAITWLRSHVSRARERCLTYYSVGRWGERVAARFLARRGIVTLQTNWRTSRFEADIIAYDHSQIIVVEVKTRHSSLRCGFPAINAITGEKLRHLNALGSGFLRNNGPLCRRFGVRTFRIDVVEVYYRGVLGFLKLSSEVRWHRGVTTSS